mmetsp:Transcript_47318/g.137821  ORF Transcript_47318/g.137821 Transcript_47318/m.137821 type:complete len:322 (+) Transcript_47318:824-1789(+)
MDHHLLPGRQGDRRRPVDDLQIALGAKLDEDVLQRVLGAVDHQQLQYEVEGVDLQEGLNVDGVGEARHLLDLRQALGEEGAVRRGLAGDRGTARDMEVVVVVNAGGAAGALALPELPEDDALVRADTLFLHLDFAAEGPLGILRRQFQDLRELRAATLRRPLGLHELGRRKVRLLQGAAAIADKQPDALREAHSAVALLPAATMLPHELVQVDEDEQALVLHGIREIRHLEDQLRHRDAEHRREQEIAAEQQRPQVRLFRVRRRGVFGVDGLLFALRLLVHALRAVGSIGEHHGASRDLAGARRRRLLLALAGGAEGHVLL